MQRKLEHIPGTLPPRQGVPAKETAEQRHARLYPGPADREEGARYYVTRVKANREYLKVWTKPPWRDGSTYEAAACAVAGNPNTVSSTSAAQHWLTSSCRRVTVPLEMPEPWRSILIPLSQRATKAAIDDLFSDNIPCPTCGFQQNCEACQARVLEAAKEQ